jgi:hypothetical protein
MSSEKEIQQFLIGLRLDTVTHVFACFDDGVEAGIENVFVDREFFVYRIFQLSAGLVGPAAPEQSRGFENQVGFAKQNGFHCLNSFVLLNTCFI